MRKTFSGKSSLFSKGRAYITSGRNFFSGVNNAPEMKIFLGKLLSQLEIKAR